MDDLVRLHPKGSVVVMVDLSCLQCLFNGTLPHAERQLFAFTSKNVAFCAYCGPNHEPRSAYTHEWLVSSVRWESPEPVPGDLYPCRAIPSVGPALCPPCTLHMHKTCTPWFLSPAYNNIAGPCAPFFTRAGTNVAHVEHVQHMGQCSTCFTWSSRGRGA